ncbi:Benzoate 4-monooxygenase [Hyphodiscus hymeniophilus]|uniref:Benzoate 4-monooxygenase n=1 Tax=Hyphodiscus hymeniophilus TaxID=353542 RepID=A0A9P6VLF3_9HELO|nr:Benzoate 4-monooxygenase [Hyphodiscus hymeniophilus]
MLGPIFATVVALLLLTTFVLKPIFDFFRDPKGLRRYPSMNIFCGLTNLGYIYEAHKPFRSKKLEALHKIHPVIRTGPNALSYGDIRAIKDIYGHGTTCTKDIWYDKLGGTHPHLADVHDKHEHARKRKVLSSAYSLKNLEGWEHKVADKTERFIKGIDKLCTEPLSPHLKRPNPEDLTVDYRMWANFFTLDAIADIGLSERLGFLDAGNDLVTAERMDGTTYTVNYRECLHSTAQAQCGTVWSYDWFPHLITASKVLSSRYRYLWKRSEDWGNIVYHRAMKRFRLYQKGEKFDDFFQALLEDKGGNPNNLPWGEMVAEVSIMMNAGSDTTAIAMNNVMYLLLKNPDCLKKLQEEVDSALEPDEIIAPYDKVKHLPYLRACLDESMRIYPPTTFGLPRRTPPEGCVILGEFIPGETSVSMSSYVAHRDPTIFPDPETFLPSRWLTEDSKQMQYAFQAFSTGARGCIGRNISYLEQTVLLSSVVHRYEFALPHPEWEQERKEVFNLMPGRLPLKASRRGVMVD